MRIRKKDAPPNHYSDIGFSIRKERDVAKLWKRLVNRGAGESLPSAHGSYHVVRVDEAIEFWFHCSSEGKIYGLDFHFATENKLEFRLESWLEPDFYDAMSAKVQAWLCLPESGEEFCPLVVDVANGDLHRDILPDARIAMQLACFAEHVRYFADEESYFASQEEGGVQMSDEHIIPTGLFAAETEETGQQRKGPLPASMLMGGRVEFAFRRRNSMDGGEYYHIGLRCQGALFDVLADAAFFAREPEPGGILAGSYWVSGRLLGHATGGELSCKKV